MKNVLGDSGTILAWSQGFEIGVIKELIEYRRINELKETLLQ